MYVILGNTACEVEITENEQNVLSLLYKSQGKRKAKSTLDLFCTSPQKRHGTTNSISLSHHEGMEVEAEVELLTNNQQMVIKSEPRYHDYLKTHL